MQTPLILCASHVLLVTAAQVEQLNLLHASLEHTQQRLCKLPVNSVQQVTLVLVLLQAALLSQAVGMEQALMHDRESPSAAQDITVSMEVELAWLAQTASFAHR
jgi:hypothetical protein